MGLISRVSSRTYRYARICSKMPPKKAANKESKKTKEKKTQKAVEDKTFGLKNKKGAKQQAFIAQVQKQAQHKHMGNQKAKEEQKSKKAQKQAYLDQLDAILKPVNSERKVILSKKQ